MTFHKLLAQKREAILRLAVSRHARKVRVFGSFARGTARKDSDIDLLVIADTGDFRKDVDLVQSVARGNLSMIAQDLLQNVLPSVWIGLSALRNVIVSIPGALPTSLYTSGRRFISRSMAFGLDKWSGPKRVPEGRSENSTALSISDSPPYRNLLLTSVWSAV